jgi:hypothetical protein
MLSYTVNLWCEEDIYTFFLSFFLYQTYIFGDVGDAVHKCMAPQDLSGQEGGSNLGSTVGSIYYKKKTRTLFVKNFPGLEGSNLEPVGTCIVKSCEVTQKTYRKLDQL